MTVETKFLSFNKLMKLIWHTFKEYLIYILNSLRNVRFEISMPVAMDQAVFWDVMPCIL
jgi:hypothetical protein